MVAVLRYVSSIDQICFVQAEHEQAFDVVGELTFEKKLGFMEKGGDVDGMLEAIEGMLVYASQCGQVPEAHPFLLGNPIFPIIMPVSARLGYVGVVVDVQAENGDLEPDLDVHAQSHQHADDHIKRWRA